MKNLKFVLVIVISLFVSVGCQQEDKIEMESDNNEYLNLYDNSYIQTGIGDLTVEDLTKIHNSIASIYQVRSELQLDWMNRSKYTLDKELFANEYIYNYMKMYLYENVRYLTVDNTYIESIEIDKNNLKKVDNLYLVSVIVTDVVPDSNDYDVYEQFFVFKRDKNELFVFVNFITGYLFDKENEIYPKIRVFGQNDWNKSIYSTGAEKNIKNYNSTNTDKYLEFIQGDMPKSEYIKTRKINNNISKSSSSYNRQTAVNYATTYTSINAGTASYNNNYKSFSVDCANFVSQCLKAGGFKYDYGSYGSCTSWYYNTNGTSTTSDDDNSNSWSTANGLKRYLYDCGSYTKVIYPDDLWYGNNVDLGDPFFFDRTPPTNEAPYYNHSMIVTKIVNGWDVRYSAHTSNRKNRTIHHASTNYDFWFTDRWTRGFHIVKTN